MKNIFLPLLALLLSFAATARADSTVAVSDRYSCSRLGDGKLHVVKITDTGFIVVKKGVAENDYSRELKRIANRIDLLDEYRIKASSTLSLSDLKRLTHLLQTGDSLPDLSSKEKILSSVSLAIATAKARRKTVKIYLNALAKCEKQRFPGIDAVSAVVVPIYVRGSVASTAGYLISVPKPSNDSQRLHLCLAYLDVFTPAGIDPEKAADNVIFSRGICGTVTSGDGVLDCTGPVPKGFLSFYLKKVNFFERSPDPSSDTVINQLAQLASIGDSLNFKVQPVSRATGSECEKLR